MPPAAGIAIPAALGVLGGVSQAKQQKKLAAEAAKPRPYSSTTTTGPPPWVQEALRQALGDAQGFYADRSANPRLPPTFLDVTEGRYGRPLPSSPLGGLAPAGPDVQEAWTANAARKAVPPEALIQAVQEHIAAGEWTPERGQQRIEDWKSKNPAELTDSQRQAISERVQARQAPTGMYSPSRAPGRGGGGGGGGGGMSSGGGSAPNARQALAQLVLERAQRPTPGADAGLGFIQNLLGRTMDQTPGGQQQQQTFEDFRDPTAPINQLIQRGTQGSFSSAAPLQQQLAQRFMGGIDSAPAAPVNYFDRYLGMAGYGG